MFHIINGSQVDIKTRSEENLIRMLEDAEARAERAVKEAEILRRELLGRQYSNALK